jgi:hypothetical protein
MIKRVICLLTLILFSVMVNLGCSKSMNRGASGDPIPESLIDKSPNEYTMYFQNWLKSHGEKMIVTKGAAVTLEGNPALFAARTFSKNNQDNGSTVEVEFLTTLPDGRIIQDFVAGMGKDVKAAQEDALANFTLTTSHVLYSAFFNEKDDHMPPKIVTLHGKSRKIYVGDLYVRGATPGSESLDAVRRFTMETIKKTLPDDDKPHWFKVVYGQNQGEMLSSQATMDLENDSDFNREMKQISWPKSDSFYLLKMFVLVK